MLRRRLEVLSALELGLIPPGSVGLDSAFAAAPRMLELALLDRFNSLPATAAPALEMESFRRLAAELGLGGLGLRFDIVEELL